MRPKNIAQRRGAQGKIALYSLEVTVDELNQDDCPVEVISITANLDWRLRHLHRGGVVRVHHVLPCPGCEAPIAVLRLETERVLRICDAIEERDCVSVWSANIFEMHECPEDQQ